MMTFLKGLETYICSNDLFFTGAFLSSTFKKNSSNIAYELILSKSKTFFSSSLNKKGSKS